MSWRSTIKGKARDVVTQPYDIGKHRTEEENQRKAVALIKGVRFLRDSVDDEVHCMPAIPICLHFLQGSTNNMAHPALAMLITEFFYRPSSLCTVFPEVFSHEVPRVAVCLAATAV